MSGRRCRRSTCAARRERADAYVNGAGLVRGERGRAADRDERDVARRRRSGRRSCRAGRRCAFEQGAAGDGGDGQHPAGRRAPQLEGIHYLRAFGNSDAIREEAEAAEQVVLIGGSYIGCEVAASLTAQGKSCTIVMMEDVAALAGLRRGGRAAGSTGCSSRRGSRSTAARSSRSSRATAGCEAVVTKSGREVEGDMVVIGAGVRPDVMLAERAGLEVDDGIVCDSKLQTSVEGIYAAGDCCSYDSVVHGRRLRVEHWDVAMQQGQAAAATCSARTRDYDVVPYFFSDLADWASLEYVGPAQRLGRGDLARRPRRRRVLVWYLKDGKVAGALSVEPLRGPRRGAPHARRRGRRVGRPGAARGRRQRPLRARRLSTGSEPWASTSVRRAVRPGVMAARLALDAGSSGFESLGRSRSVPSGPICEHMFVSGKAAHNEKRSVGSSIEGRSLSEISRDLGISKGTVAYHARRLGKAGRRAIRRRYDWAEIQRSIRPAASRCGSAPHVHGFNVGSWFKAVQRGDIVPRPERMSIDESAHATGKRRGRAHLKRRILAEGLKEARCERCGNSRVDGPADEHWQLHHVNGDGADNRIENLAADVRELPQPDGQLGREDAEGEAGRNG